MNKLKVQCKLKNLNMKYLFTSNLLETVVLFGREENFIFIAQKIKFSIKNFVCKCDQIQSFLRILSHLLKKSLMENFIFVQWFAKPYWASSI